MRSSEVLLRSNTAALLLSSISQGNSQTPTQRAGKQSTPFGGKNYEVFVLSFNLNTEYISFLFYF